MSATIAHGREAIRPRARGWLLALAVTGPLAVFTGLAVRVADDDGGLGWDRPATSFFQAIAPVSSEEVHVDPYLRGVTIAIGLACAALFLRLLAQRALRSAVFLAAGIVVPVGVSTMVKALVRRPPIEGDATEYSFPSGSATWAMATVAAVLLVAGSRRTRVPIALGGAAFLFVYDGTILFEEWHYPSDVVAGSCLAVGIVVALWLSLVDRPWRRRRRRAAGAAPHQPSS
jgi:membrane-associated phospholipid phosphatase